MEVAALKDNMSILDIKIVDLQLVVDSRTEQNQNLQKEMIECENKFNE